jgi:hypothetical protein
MDARRFSKGHGRPFEKFPRGRRCGIGDWEANGQRKDKD